MQAVGRSKKEVARTGIATRVEVQVHLGGSAMVWRKSPVEGKPQLGESLPHGTAMAWVPTPQAATHLAANARRTSRRRRRPGARGREGKRERERDRKRSQKKNNKRARREDRGRDRDWDNEDQ